MKVAARLAAVASGVALVTAMGAGVAVAAPGPPPCPTGFISAPIAASTNHFVSVTLHATVPGCQVVAASVTVQDDETPAIPPMHLHVTQAGPNALVTFFAAFNTTGTMTDPYTANFKEIPLNNNGCGPGYYQKCCKPVQGNYQKCCGPPGSGKQMCCPPGQNNKYPQCCPKYPGNNKYPQCCPKYPGNNKYPQCCPQYPGNNKYPQCCPKGQGQYQKCCPKYPGQGQKCQPPPPPHKKCVVKKYWHKGHLYKKVYCPGKHHKKYYP